MDFSRVRLAVPCGSAALGALALALTLSAQSKATCDQDNGGLKLPQGFCALVAADGLGTARHLAVAPNGDVYVALQTRGGRGPSATGGGVVGLRDADGDGKFEIKEAFGAGSSTGIALHNGYLYLAHPTSVERFKMTAGQLKPTGEPETIVTDLPGERQHEDKGLAFDAADRCTSTLVRRPTHVSSPIASRA
jgi:glucose/arabinose dehydrogenase